ncbi:hypothetical protein BC831DRAFT_403256 [Entophlyctis helioformis]|nr:hypothetical protein BC831DRAFT_403256 [Entophlyctis helioformis]
MPGPGSLVVQSDRKETFTFSVELDLFLVFFSYWTAVLSTYTSVQVLDQLMLVYRVYIAMNVHKLMTHPRRIKNPYLRQLYVYFFINAKIITSIFMIAIALGACGIWGMHFLGMHALHLYVVPHAQNNMLPIFDPYVELIKTKYFMIIPVYFDGWVTLISLVLAVVAVFIGMLIAAFGAGMIHTRVDAKGLPEIMKKFRQGSLVTNSIQPSRIRDSKPMNDMPSQSKTPSSAMHPTQTPRRMSSAVAPPVSTSPLAVDEVGVALNINTTSFFKLRPIRQVIFVFGAFVTGLGVAAMHYCGVAAMKVPGVTMRHHSGVVLLAIAIGVTVAMAGLWILFFLRGFIPRLLSPFVIGIAVFSLHYVGMYGVTFELNSDLFSFDYDGFMQTNKFLVGGLRIEAVRAQVDFTLELVILAISFHTLQI